MEIADHSSLTKQDHWNKRQEAAVPSISQLRMTVMTKDNCRQKNVHTVERSWATIRTWLESRNKCPYVIDYTLQANEIKRAWIDSEESCQRDVRSRVQWLYWHAHIQRASERDQSVLLVANSAVSFFTASPTTAIRLSPAQIKCKQSDLTSWRLTAETSLLRKPFFCQRQTTSRLWGKKAYFEDPQQLWFQMKEI